MSPSTQECQFQERALAPVTERSAGDSRRRDAFIARAALSPSISVPDRLNVQLSRTWIAAWILALGLALTSI